MEGKIVAETSGKTCSVPVIGPAFGVDTTSEATPQHELVPLPWICPSSLELLEGDGGVLPHVEVLAALRAWGQLGFCSNSNALHIPFISFVQ